MPVSPRIWTTLSGLAVLVLLAAACAPRYAPAPSPTPAPAPALTPAPAPTPTPAPAPAPSLKIVSPAEGARIPAGDVTITVEVSGFTVVGKLGQPAAPGEGHLHFFIDAEPPTAPGKPAVTAPGTYAAHFAGASYTWKNVAPGSHNFAVELVNNDHTPLSPPITAKITVTVSAPTTGGPSLRIVSPAEGARVPAGDVTITVEVSGFTVVGKLGQPAAPGEGHLHFFIDVEPPTAPGKPAVTAPGTYAAHFAGASYTWKNVAPGSHNFAVELVNNDHTPLSPPITAKVTVTVSTPTSDGGGAIPGY